MNRRGFLSGLFGGVTAAGLLVKATPADLDAFVNDLPAKAPINLTPLPYNSDGPRTVRPGQHLFDEHGALIAIVTGVRADYERVDVTTVSDLNKIFIPGTLHLRITAEGVAPLTVDTGGMRFAFRNFGRTK
jgi:hypothetical protein